MMSSQTRKDLDVQGPACDREIVDAKVIVTRPGRDFVALKVTTRSGVYALGDATLNGREGRAAGRRHDVGLVKTMAMSVFAGKTGATFAALLAIAFALPAQAREPARFDWFEYTGKDTAFERPLPPGHYRNPILAGFHPDPSITRVGDRFYLVHSTFTYFPGIPVFESADLVHWKQIGNAIERPSQLDFDGLGLSRGVFAPTIEHHDGTYYVVNTAVDAGGNFYVTATDPAGPWSDPVWLRGVEGIDPAFFFDDDGKVYLLNNDAPPGGSRYDGHRAIWMQEMDLRQGRPVGPRTVLLDGGVDPAAKPIWIEGPHLYKREGWYYLVCAEGGTSVDHSQVVLRSRDVRGPYRPYPHNPILTQRDLAPDRADAIANAGHADLVEGPDGGWWAVFLASRVYDRVRYNTGRETYLLPVSWKDGWPVILPAGKPIPQIVAAPSLVRGDAHQAPLSGNFTWRDEFDGPALDRAWMFVRVPKRRWTDLSAQPGWLLVDPLRERLDTTGNPSFLARRQQHLAFDASTALALPVAGIAAGLAVLQSGDRWYFLGVRRSGDGAEVFLEKGAGEGRPAETVAKRAAGPADALRLKISGDKGRYSFGFATDGGAWQWLVRDADATFLSTDEAGGFVGATLGPYARDERTPTE